MLVSNARREHRSSGIPGSRVRCPSVRALQGAGISVARMSMLTDTHLRRIMPNASESTRARYLQPLWQAMQEYQIVTLARAAAFLAQIAHESGELQFMQ